MHYEEKAVGTRDDTCEFCGSETDMNYMKLQKHQKCKQILTNNLTTML